MFMNELSKTIKTEGEKKKGKEKKRKKKESKLKLLAYHKILRCPDIENIHLVCDVRFKILFNKSYNLFFFIVDRPYRYS